MKRAIINALIGMISGAGVSAYMHDYAAGPALQATNFLFLAAGTCPAGWVQDTSFDGKFLRVTVAANGNVGATGGSATLTATGSNSAPVFTGSSASSSSDSAGTPTGTVAAPTFTGSSANTSSNSAGTPAGTNTAPAFTGSSANTSLVSGGTPAGTVAAPTLTMNSYTPAGTNASTTATPLGTVAWPTAAPIVTTAPITQMVQHTHTTTATLTVQGGTTASVSGTHVMTSTATGGSARAVTSGDSIAASTANPTSSVPSFVTANSVQWPTVPAKYGAAVRANNGSGTTGASSAFLQKTVATHAILCGIAIGNASSQTLTSVTDTEGNSYTVVGAGASDTVNHEILYIAYAFNITGGTASNIVTGHFSASTTNSVLTCIEVAGLTTSDPIDKSGYQYQSSTSTPTAPVATVTPTTNGQFLFGVSNQSSNVGGASVFSATGSYTKDETQIGSANQELQVMEWQVQTTAAAVQATLSNTTSGAYITGLATFKTAGSSVPAFTGSSTTVPAETFTGSAATLTGTNSAPAFTGSALASHQHTLTATGTVDAPTFTGSALGGHQHTLTATGTNSAPTFTGSVLGTHSHTVTATGTNSAPTFTGNAVTNTPSYVNVILCKPASPDDSTTAATKALMLHAPRRTRRGTIRTFKRGRTS